MTTQTVPTRRATTSAVSPREWRTSALCRETDPDLFFPTGVGPTAQAQRQAAKEMCFACTVRTHCLEWAMKEEYAPLGVWGGLDEWERAALSTSRLMPQMDWCRANQALIETRLEEGVSLRAVARELGVRSDCVRRAVAEFAEEQAQLDAAVEAVSA